MLLMAPPGWGIMGQRAHHRAVTAPPSTPPPIEVREIGGSEFGLVWPIFRTVVGEGETYAYDPATTFEEARALWTRPPARCFVAAEQGQVVGAYCLRPNQVGL